MWCVYTRWDKLYFILSVNLFVQIVSSFFPFNFAHRLTFYANSLLLRPRPGIAHEPLDPTSIKLVHTPSCDTHLHGHIKDDMYNAHMHTYTHTYTLTHDRHL